MKQLDVEHFPNLKELLLQDKFVEVDVTSLSNLEKLDVQDNNLLHLDVSHNPGIIEFYASENPNLTCIQVAEVHLADDQNRVLVWGKDDTLP